MTTDSTMTFKRNLNSFLLDSSSSPNELNRNKIARLLADSDEDSEGSTDADDETEDDQSDTESIDIQTCIDDMQEHVDALQTHVNALQTALVVAVLLSRHHAPPLSSYGKVMLSVNNSTEDKRLHSITRTSALKRVFCGEDTQQCIGSYL